MMMMMTRILLFFSKLKKRVFYVFLKWRVMYKTFQNDDDASLHYVLWNNEQLQHMVLVI